MKDLQESSPYGIRFWLCPDTKARTSQGGSPRRRRGFCHPMTRQRDISRFWSRTSATLLLRTGEKAADWNRKCGSVAVLEIYGHGGPFRVRLGPGPDDYLSQNNAAAIGQKFLAGRSPSTASLS